MRFSHISDTHLGLIQYNSEERENDVYDAFNQAIELDPRQHIAYANSSLAHRILGNKPQAIESIKKAIELKPDSSEYRQVLHKLEAKDI